MGKFDGMDLNALAREVAGILQSRTVGAPNSGSPNTGLEQPRASKAAHWARNILSVRRQRRVLLGADIFGEPAWNMLLDLFAAEREGKSISISSLCFASGVPATTALRWIKLLEDRGMIQRRPDKLDKRRYYLSLSPETDARIANLAKWSFDRRGQ